MITVSEKQLNGFKTEAAKMVACGLMSRSYYYKIDKKITEKKGKLKTKKINKCDLCIHKTFHCSKVNEYCLKDVPKKFNIEKIKKAIRIFKSKKDCDLWEASPNLTNG